MTKAGWMVLSAVVLVAGVIGFGLYRGYRSNDPLPTPDSPYVTLPQAINKDAGGNPLQPATYITVAADTNCPVVSWMVTSADIQLFPPSLLKDTKTAVLVATKPGVYTVYAWSGSCGGPTQASQCVLTVGTLPPPTPPIPPVPPTPPTPPEPIDPAWPYIKAAWLTENAADKAKLPSLVSLMSVAVAKSNDPAVAKVLDLFNALHAAKADLMGGALANTWKAVGTELNNAVSVTPDQAMDAATRQRCVAAFTRLGNLLQALNNVK
jgi:hypothetical protein